MKPLYLLVFLSILTNIAFAVRINSIYQVQIPVSSQSNEEKDQAVLQGLSQVLLKVSGQPLSNSLVNLKTAASLMQEYRYVSIQSKNFLEMRFDQQAVNKLLHDNKVIVWGAKRPLILTWIVFESSTQPPQIIDNSQSDVQTILNLSAEHHGLPVLLPQMDIQDLNQVNVSDITHFAIPTLQLASQRYASDAILVAHIFSQENNTSAKAKLLLGKESWDLSANGNNVAIALANLVDKVTVTLATRFAVGESSVVQKQILLKITGITQQSDFAQLMQYIQHMSIVTRVQPAKIAGDEMELNISLRGSLDAFIQAISQDEKLTALADNSNPNVLTYQWNP